MPLRQLFTTTLHGILPEDRLVFFERMVFRVSRGNAVLKSVASPGPGMPDPAHPRVLVRKVVFSLFFVGAVLAKRLSKIVAHFGGTEYEVPQDPREIARRIAQLVVRIADTKAMLLATDKQTRSMLEAIVWDDAIVSSPYVNYTHALFVEKAICDTLKRCEVGREGSSMLRCEAWIPRGDFDGLQAHLKRAVIASGGQAAACQRLSPADTDGQGMPPTYFQTNKFTEAYQGIVDTYGVPRYKEVNPGLFTIISFPFLFGVMYGDGELKSTRTSTSPSGFASLCCCCSGADCFVCVASLRVFRQWAMEPC